MGGGTTTGSGIAFTEKEIICDTRDMSSKTLTELVRMHDDWKAGQEIEKAERRERVIGYVHRVVEYVKSYF